MPPAFAGMAMKPEVEIYDTTLRDGTQGEGINFSALDKLRIAEKLDAFGVHYIEGGWPGSAIPRTSSSSSRPPGANGSMPGSPPSA